MQRTIAIAAVASLALLGACAGIIGASFDDAKLATADAGGAPPYPTDDGACPGCDPFDGPPTPIDARAPDSESDAAGPAACPPGPEGGAPCDPHVVQCRAGGGCTTPSTFCCRSEKGNYECRDAGASRVDCTGTFECNEAADCPTGQVCCVVIGSNGTPSLACLASCDKDYDQICRTHAECPSGTCMVEACDSGTIEVCGPKPGCR